jgi:hypothetical protein
MFIRNSTWYRIRADFTEAEKSELSESITGESICPPGLTVDLRHNPELAGKVLQSMTRVSPGA